MWQKPVVKRPLDSNQILLFYVCICIFFTFQASGFEDNFPCFYSDDSLVMYHICANNKMCFFLETGSGKTTQVPQFILEHAEERGTAVRIVCTEPRRIAAVAMADRSGH